MIGQRFLPVALIALGLGSPALAQTSYPMVMRVEPTALQRGQTTTITVNGSGSFEGASALLFGQEGLSAKINPPEPPKPAPTPAKSKKAATTKGADVGRCSASVTVAKEAQLGPCEVRVVTPQGVSSIGMVVITADPVVEEGDDKANTTREGASTLKLPVAVSGKIGINEDVDWFKIDAKAGERLTFEVWANRLEDKIHDLQTHFDPILILHAADGRELASNDNGRFADPALSFAVKEAGSYFVEVRDTGYAGNAHWTYVLQATNGPVVYSFFPNAVNPGKVNSVEPFGVGFADQKKLALDIPTTQKPGIMAIPVRLNEGTTWPVSCVVTRLPILVEESDASAEKGTESRCSIPVAISGRLGMMFDVDRFLFDAKKGRSYRFEVMARRLGSEMDPIVRILNATGGMLVEADDSPGLGKDSRIEWTAPSDGTFSLEVTDLHGRGGPGFGYTILAEESKPDFVLNADPDKINAGPGSRAPVFIKIERLSGFKGAVTVEMAGLPKGMTASPLTLGPEVTQGVVVVSAARDATPNGSLVQVQGRGAPAEPNLSHGATPMQEIYLPGGGRGLFRVGTLAAAVTKPSDIEVEAVQDQVVLKPGGTAVIDLTVKRRADFDKPVNLAINLEHLGGVFASPLPKGVTVEEKGSKTLLGPKETKGKIVLKAAADAPEIEGVPITVMGHVSINFVVKTAYCTAPIKLSVKKGSPSVANR